MAERQNAENVTHWYAWAPPSGVQVDNMRKRGVDVLRIRLPGSSKSRRLAWELAGLAVLLALTGVLLEKPFLGLTAATVSLLAALVAVRNTRRGSWDISIASNVITILERGEPRPSRCSFVDVESISLREPGKGIPASLVITAHNEQVAFGHGHSIERLNWLKSTLIMEVAGLTWKPLHGVDRTRTRSKSETVNNPVLLKPDLAMRLIGIYQALAPVVLDDLRDAVAAKDPVAIRQHAHWLKSASANIGARHLSELCQLMQIYGAQNELTRTDILCKEIERKNTEIMKWLVDIRETAASSIAEAVKDQAREEIRPQAATGLADAADATTAAAASMPAAQAAPHSPAIEAKVLVVDDSAVSREIASEYLSDMVTSVVFANDGAAAVELFDATKFDLILMDCEMYGMDGFECTRRLRQKERLRPGERTPIIALTAHALQGDRTRCMAAGMDDYLSKPYAPEDLLDKIETWLAKRETELELTAAGEAQATDAQTPAHTVEPEPAPVAFIEETRRTGRGKHAFIKGQAQQAKPERRSTLMTALGIKNSNAT